MSSKSYFIPFMLLCLIYLDTSSCLSTTGNARGLTNEKIMDALSQQRYENPTFNEGSSNNWDTSDDYETNVNNEIPLLHSKNLEDKHLKRSSYFYPLRGKKAYASRKASMSLFPVRGKKLNSIPILPKERMTNEETNFNERLLGIKADNQKPYLNFNLDTSVPSDDNADVDTNSINYVNSVKRTVDDDTIPDNENSDPSVFSPKLTGKYPFDAVNGWDIDRRSDIQEGEKQTEENVQKSLKTKMIRRDKRKIFPFITTWRLFQSLKTAAQPPEGNKREALFFASRGKRSRGSLRD